MDHFLPFNPLTTRKIKFLQKWKNAWRYHFTNVYRKWKSYDIWFLRDGVPQTEFVVILGHFCPLTPLTTWKKQNLKKWKKCLGISSFYTYIPQMKIIWCMVTEIRCTTDFFFFFFSFWVIFCPFTLLTTQKIKILKKWKKIIIIISYTAPEIWYMTDVTLSCAC